MPVEKESCFVATKLQAGPSQIQLLRCGDLWSTVLCRKVGKGGIRVFIIPSRILWQCVKMATSLTFRIFLLIVLSFMKFPRRYVLKN